MSARPQTAIAAALHRAGLNTSKTQLYQLGVDTLRKHRAERDRGFSVFERKVEDDPDLIREALFFYYERLDTDMSGGTRQSNGDSGHPPPVNQNSGAASSANGASHGAYVALASPARPVREPSQEDRAASARVANSIAVTVFDSFKVRDGRGIGDVRFGELKRMMTTNAREAAVIRQIIEHGDAPHDAQVRDVVKRDVLERMVQRAAEIVDAAQ